MKAEIAFARIHSRYPLTQSFTYAGAGSGPATGKLTSATSNGITRSLSYGGPAGELTGLTRTVDGRSFTMGYEYDAATGNLTSRTYPDGRVQTISYDAERNLPSGTRLNGATLASFGYDGTSWLRTGLTYGNNGTTVFGYMNERLATMAHAIPGKALASWAFAYDQADQLLTDGEDAFGYDALGRLVQADLRDPQDAAPGHGLQQVIGYDAFGNRTSLSSQKVTNWTDPTTLPASPSRVALSNDPRPLRSYAMTSGEIAGMGATNHLPATIGGVSTGAAYDAQGNLTAIYGTPGTSATQLTLTYDALGRVTRLGDTAKATSQSYGYDDEGLRIKVTDSKTGLTSYNLYDESRHLIAQYEVPSGGSLTWKKDLVYVGDKEIAEVDASHTWVEFLDHLGSPRYAWDGSATNTVDGVHLIAQKYAPFGEYLNDTATQAKFAKGFTNHEQTDPSGLIYMQSRFYLPMYGRFASPDGPGNDQHFEQTQSWNTYSYLQNDPTMRIDPTGEVGISDVLNLVMNLSTAYAIHQAMAPKPPPLTPQQVAAAQEQQEANLAQMKEVTNRVMMVLPMLGGLMSEPIEEAPEPEIETEPIPVVEPITAEPVVTPEPATELEGAGGTAGRGKNRLQPDPQATGEHSTFKRGADGSVSNHAEYKPNAKNPSGFQEVKRVDVSGKAHTNPDGTVVQTPHVKEAGTKGVRPARPDELPRRN